MSQEKVYTAIGLMSGTSLDGVDCAMIETDGRDYIKPLAFTGASYATENRDTIRAAFGITDKKSAFIQEIEDIVTAEHIKAVQNFGHKADVIGFHGQTIYHAPKDGITVQLGNGARMARETGMDVVADFRADDVKAGGEGAPLAPIYHAARIKSAKIEEPCVVLNIGGVANVTYIDGNELIAFDCGPGNALMDDWMLSRTRKRYDEDGKRAAAGAPSEHFLEQWLSNDYFARPYPKSLDRDAWDVSTMSGIATDEGVMSVEDGAATLLTFTLRGILKSLDHLPQKPKAWYVCGGGRRNKFLMKKLNENLGVPVHTVEHLGWNGDATEAECFAYLAVRKLLDLPISFPKTTGVPIPMTGGVLFKA